MDEGVSTLGERYRQKLQHWRLHAPLWQRILIFALVIEALIVGVIYAASLELVPALWVGTICTTVLTIGTYINTKRLEGGSNSPDL